MTALHQRLQLLSLDSPLCNHFLCGFLFMLISIFQVHSSLFSPASKSPFSLPSLFLLLEAGGLSRWSLGLYPPWLVVEASGNLWSHQRGWCSPALSVREEGWTSFPVMGILTLTQFPGVRLWACYPPACVSWVSPVGLS